MGGKPSPILAVLVMHNIESSTLFRYSFNHPVFYAEYLNGISTTIDNDAAYRYILTNLDGFYFNIRLEFRKLVFVNSMQTMTTKSS